MFCRAQKPAATPNSQAIRSSSAYAEVILRKTDLESDVESLLTTYTEEFPKLKESRYELGLIQKDLQTLLSQSDAPKLTLALGKLLVRRAELNVALWSLQKRFGDDHPDVKRARKKASIFDAAVKEILN